MPTDIWTDRKHLQEEAYASSDNLQARADIYAFQQPRIDLYRWALAQISWEAVHRVLDIGCGPGSYLQQLAARPALELIGIDLSAGMLQDLRKRWQASPTLPYLACGDAQHIPLATGCLDVALAMHMLYHVPDIAQAIQELRRVLRPGGTLLALTNSNGHLIELFECINDAIDRLAARAVADRGPVIRRFRLDDAGPLLAATFEHVERRDVQAELLVPSVEPVLRYLNSTRATREPQLPPGLTWAALENELAQRVQQQIRETGVFRVRTHSGLFICR